MNTYDVERLVEKSLTVTTNVKGFYLIVLPSLSVNVQENKNVLSKGACLLKLQDRPKRKSPVCRSMNYRYDNNHVANTKSQRALTKFSVCPRQITGAKAHKPALNPAV